MKSNRRLILFNLFCVMFCAMIILPFTNFFLARIFLLRMRDPIAPMDEIKNHMAPVARPLVLKSGGEGNEERLRFEAGVGLKADTDLPSMNGSLIEIKDVIRLIPYPQPLAAIHGAEVNYLSYGYLGTDERYHQVTYYWGESDSTPSIFVPKARGRETGWGDYFVRYTVHLSRDLKERPQIIDSQTGKVVKYSPPPPYPDLDRIEWSSYEGGSSNAFEEILLAIFGTLIEMVLIIIAFLIWHNKRPALAARQGSSTGGDTSV